MVTATLRRNNPLSASQVLTVLGAVTAIFSVVMGLLVLFVIPGGCSFLGGLELVLLAGLFLAGAILFTVGKARSRRTARYQPPLS